MSAREKPTAGRPPVGPNINVRMSQDLVDWIDQQAKANGQTRAEAIRACLEAMRNMDEWVTFQQESRARRDEEEVRAILTIEPGSMAAWGAHWSRVPNPEEHLRRVLALWRERHADGCSPYDARYAWGVAMHRVGFRSTPLGVRHLSPQRRQEVRTQIDAIVGEVRTQMEAQQ